MIDFLYEILKIDSTSGTEHKLAEFLIDHFHPSGSVIEIQEVNNKQLNLFYKWGDPKIIFCTHYDTVPPYIPPTITELVVFGRGACDAKGQIAVMSEVCNQLYDEGETEFGLLLLSGEEHGSYGAKCANELIKKNEFIIIGEPTANKLIEASKGTLLAKINFNGVSCHSGYPEHGESAINRMIKFLDRLSKIRFDHDEILGNTTYNIGRLMSNNAHNVISDSVEISIFFRTTWKSYENLKNTIKGIADEKTEIQFSSFDKPMSFLTLPGFETDVASFGTDAPSLSKLGKKLLYGPGSILDAHTNNEHIKIVDLFTAVNNLKKMYYLLKEATFYKKNLIKKFQDS
jgi:acetylornithine deacetylase